MVNNEQILEALKVQPLSEEEKNKKHILGRLFGPIATSNEATRNGRRYNKELWEKALADDLFKEKIANKALFLELGHPEDREEIDMKQVCACIPEMPKIIDGDLYAYVDILDTANGRLLKILCDYGFTPGISSRGSGDIMANDEVDPDTFYLSTFDIVGTPAVPKARLAFLRESLNSKDKTLKTALTESYKSASSEDRKIMKKTLKNLDLNLNLTESKSNKLTEGVQVGVVDGEPVYALDSSDINDNESELISEAKQEDSETEETCTIADLQKELKEFDKKATVEFAPIVIDDKEYVVNSLSFEDDKDGNVIINIDYNSDESDDIEETEIESDENSLADTKDSEAVSDTEATEEMMESLKEMVRQKEALEKTVKSLKSQQAVSDAKVKSCNEELTKYKEAFARTSEIAAQSNSLKKEMLSLKESLSKKDTVIVKLKNTQTQSLNEGLEKSKTTIQTLKENLVSKEKEINKLATTNNEQIKLYKQKLTESSNAINYYKKQCNELLESYISFRAQILGVKPSTIKNKLSEKYNIKDIDMVCESILTTPRTNSNMLFEDGAKVRINASRNIKNTDDDLSSLYELAGLTDGEY